MRIQHRLAAAVAVLALSAAACAGPGGSASAAATPQASAAPSASTAAPSLQAAADAYAALLATTNDKFTAIGAQGEAAGDDLDKLKAMWLAGAAVEDEYVAGLRAIAWPPELGDVVGKAEASAVTLAGLMRALAADPNDAVLQAQMDDVNATRVPIAEELRSRLGLPARPTDPPDDSPSPTPAG